MDLHPQRPDDERLPLAALITCRRKGLMKDRMLLLAVLMVVFSVLEAMAFRETGQRQGHGNFTWASNSSSFFLWVAMAGVFLREIRRHVQNGTLCLWRKLGLAATVALFLWQLGAGVGYYIFLMTSDYSF